MVWLASCHRRGPTAAGWAGPPPGALAQEASGALFPQLWAGVESSSWWCAHAHSVALDCPLPPVTLPAVLRGAQTAPTVACLTQGWVGVTGGPESRTAIPAGETEVEPLNSSPGGRCRG